MALLRWSPLLLALLGSGGTCHGSSDRSDSKPAASATPDPSIPGIELGQLTPREREVFAHVIAGKLNKVIAADLGTSEQTIKVHRARVMEKLDVDSVADLVRVAQQLGVSPAGG